MINLLALSQLAFTWSLTCVTTALKRELRFCADHTMDYIWYTEWLQSGTVHGYQKVKIFTPCKKNIIEMFSRSSSLTKLVFIEHVFHTAYLLWSILMHNQITWRKSQKSKSICHKRKENSLNCPFQNQTFVTNLDIHKINICQRTV